MKNTQPGEYPNFYLELPPTDYLRDIEIQDEYDQLPSDEHRGLSDEQVSQIARDSLEEAKGFQPPQPDPNPRPSDH